MENNRGLSSMDTEQNEIHCSFKDTRENKEIECCMCGDVGFQEHLFRCKTCHHRFQHIYCSRLYSDQLELDAVNICDWCLHFEANEKIQRHKRKVELQEIGSRKAKKVTDSEIVSRSASTNAMKQPTSVTIENHRKANGNITALKIQVRHGGSKQNQLLSLPEGCKLSTESCRNVPRTSPQRNNSKSGLGRRYKLLSDFLSL